MYIHVYVLYCNVFTYAPPGNQLLLCVASVVKKICIVCQAGEGGGGGHRVGT